MLSSVPIPSCLANHAREDIVTKTTRNAWGLSRQSADIIATKARDVMHELERCKDFPKFEASRADLADLGTNIQHIAGVFAGFIDTMMIEFASLENRSGVPNSVRDALMAAVDDAMCARSTQGSARVSFPRSSNTAGAQ